MDEGVDGWVFEILMVQGRIIHCSVSFEDGESAPRAAKVMPRAGGVYPKRKSPEACRFVAGGEEEEEEDAKPSAVRATRNKNCNDKISLNTVLSTTL